jgi:uncharacterized damage-inducible protein DinB
MITRQLERSFSQLEKIRAEILETVSSLPVETLNTPTDEGKWSILQILHHVAIVEAGTLQYIKKKSQKPNDIPKIGFLVPLKMVFLAMVLRSNIKIKAPKILGEPPIQLELKVLVNNWEQTRGDFYLFLEQLPEDSNNKAVFKHPMVGRIGLVHMLKFLIEHFEHHERQIAKYLKSIN